MFLDEQAVEPNLLQKLHQGFFFAKNEPRKSSVPRSYCRGA